MYCINVLIGSTVWEFDAKGQTQRFYKDCKDISFILDISFMFDIAAHSIFSYIYKRQ